MRKLALNINALEFTASKYETLAMLNETFHNDSYKKSAFRELQFDEVICTYGSTDLSLLEVIKKLQEVTPYGHVGFMYGKAFYKYIKGIVSGTSPENVVVI